MYRVEGGKDSIRVKVERVDSELYHIYIHTTPLCHSFSMGAAQRASVDSFPHLLLVIYLFQFHMITSPHSIWAGTGGGAER